MWKYEKKLEYPVNITNKDLKMAKAMFAQYGGPDSELAAALRYLNQRYTMPCDKGKALLTDIGTEELGHVEMICAMFYQLTKGATIEELKEYGLDQNYSQHGREIFMTDSFGNPFNVAHIGATGDALADLSEDMAAEEKARATYEHLMDLTTDPCVLSILNYLRTRELVHFQRFKELYDYYKERNMK